MKIVARAKIGSRLVILQKQFRLGFLACLSLAIFVTAEADQNMDCGLYQSASLYGADSWLCFEITHHPDNTIIDVDSFSWNASPSDLGSFEPFFARYATTRDPTVIYACRRMEGHTYELLDELVHERAIRNATVSVTHAWFPAPLTFSRAQHHTEDVSCGSPSVSCSVPDCAVAGRTVRWPIPALHGRPGFECVRGSINSAPGLTLLARINAWLRGDTLICRSNNPRLDPELTL